MSDRAASKLKRQKLLLELIEREDIARQSQLREWLGKRGFRVNQATLSRDLRELGVIKVPMGPTGSRYVMPGRHSQVPGQHEETLRRLVRSVAKSGNLLVMKTGPGHAQAASLALDHLSFPGVIGTVAGDDAFVVVMDETVEFAQTYQAVLDLVGLHHPR